MKFSADDLNERAGKVVSAIGAVILFYLYIYIYIFNPFLVVCCDRDCFNSGVVVRFFISILLHNISPPLFFFLCPQGRFSLPAPVIVRIFQSMGPIENLGGRGEP